MMCAGRQAFKSITTRIAGGLDSPERGRQGARSAKLPSASTAKGGGFMQTINPVTRHTSCGAKDHGAIFNTAKI